MNSFARVHNFFFNLKVSIVAWILAGIDASKGLPLALYSAIAAITQRWNVEVVITRYVPEGEYGIDVLLYPIQSGHPYYEAGKLVVPGTFPAGIRESEQETLRRVFQKHGLKYPSRARFLQTFWNDQAKPGPVLHLVHVVKLKAGEEIWDEEADPTAKRYAQQAQWVRINPQIDWDHNIPCQLGTERFDEILPFHRTFLSIVLEGICSEDRIAGIERQRKLRA